MLQKSASIIHSVLPIFGDTAPELLSTSVGCGNNTLMWNIGWQYSGVKMKQYILIIDYKRQGH